LLVKLKLSFYAAVFVAAPYLLRQIWSFVAPGLYLKERSVTGWLLFSSWFLFLLGSIFSVYIILPLVMSFSMGFESVYLQAAIGIGHFVSLLLMLMLGFGIMFQFPPVVFVIVSTGLVRVETLKSYRALVFVGVFIVSALLTPPDVFSQLLMGLPTYLLFEVGLLAASFTGSRYDKESEDSEKADLNSGKETDDCEKIYEEANSEDKDR
jgi:sec-independent protein translocase protein TatC